MRKTKEERAAMRAQKSAVLRLPSYSLMEEILNAVSHGLGALFAVAAIVLMIVKAAPDVKSVLCVIFYGATLFILYMVSTLYHALGLNKAKSVFRVFDHCSIFLLIAGTYTPISLMVIGGAAGWVLFGVLWAAAVLGIVLNAVDMKKFSRFSAVCYICMGWAVVFAVKPLIDSMSLDSIILLVLGGVAYTVGAVIYNIGKKVKYMHSLWHLFVLAGSVLHFISIWKCI